MVIIEMMKTYNVLNLLIYLALINYTLEECQDKILYCFDSMERRIGGITVPQCWKWSHFSCQPCSSTLDKEKVTFEKYITFCIHFYPTTVQVLNSKSVWLDKAKDIINRKSNGKNFNNMKVKSF
jgi:hypothetical protein